LTLGIRFPAANTAFVKLSIPLRAFALLGALSAGPASTQTGGSAYAIGGIAVDVAGPTADAARLAGFRIAQRKAWPLLWSRLTGGPATAAPSLTDAQLDGMVSAIESQGERFSATRYIARLGVVFDRSRAAAYLGDSTGLHSPPMLLLPLFSEGGAATLFQTKTPWRAAWARYRENVTPVDYVLAQGSASENLLLTARQVHRPDRESWRNVLARFDTVQALTAEARLVHAWPGGPITGLFIARQGPDAEELGRFTLRTASPEGLNAMLDTAVERIDAIYSTALRDGRLQSLPDLGVELTPLIGTGPLIGAPISTGNAETGSIAASVEALVATPDAASASAIEAALRATAGVTSVTTTSLSLGGTSRLLIAYDVARDALDYALDGRGLRLVTENGVTILRRRVAGDAPVPLPKPPELPSDAPVVEATTPPAPAP
jgi:hypothetical protein